MLERQQQMEPLGSYTMSPQGYDDEWGCALTANNKIQFSNSAVAKMTNTYNNTTTQQHNNTTIHLQDKYPK
jgi:hypothetical protein